MSINIILADDHKILREGLGSLIETQPDMKVIAQVEDGREAVGVVRELVPDVVVMDVAMPNLNGIEATRRITAEVPSVRVIALSVACDGRTASEMLKAGAAAFVMKESAFDELVRAIRAVLERQIYLSPGIATVVVKEYIALMQEQDQAQKTAYTNLTQREREVLQLLAEGHSTKEIAAQLHVSIKTVETHRQQIMNKVNKHTVAELTKYAIREGITSLEL